MAHTTGRVTVTINVEQIVARCEEMLRSAYEAGYEAGADLEMWNARGVGPYEDAPPAFEEWRDAYIERHRED